MTKDNLSASCGEPSHWAEFRTQLVRFVRARARVDSDTAEEIVQSVLLRRHQTSEAMPAPDNPRAWLFQCTRNAIADYFRRRQREENLQREVAAVSLDSSSLAGADADPAHGESEQRAIARCLEPLLDTLPEHYAQAVRAHDLLGVPHRQLAAQLGLSVSGAKSRVQRGRQLLRQALVDCCQFAVTPRGMPLYWEGNKKGRRCG